MWMFKPFSGKEPAPLEGRAIDVGNVKVHVRNAIAEGGFSCVYVAQDAVHPSKHYALKHMICNDEESLDLVMKEISVMKLLKGHPNVVTLVAHALFDMGRRKEALLVMEFCEKSLVHVLESRGVGYYEEKQVLLIFRDICNAVHAMHSQSPPIAHRDLKAENVLLGSDGSWKLCDFGSTSTNHKCFERPEEMGIEEDNIRKHTTPAYRAPEMWDLYRREFISEKVDIWALGCLLYRICYFKSAFDGESKLQILNGNYRIPDLPKYSSSIRNLIKDMLEASPNSRPDITQVWFRVNELLPLELQKHLPDSPTAVTTKHKQYDEGAKRTPLMPHHSSPPLPSSQEQMRNVSPAMKKDIDQRKPSQGASKTAGSPIGAFWSTEHAIDSAVSGINRFFDDEPFKQSEIKHHHASPGKKASPTPSRERSVSPVVPLNTGQGTSIKRFDNGNSGDFEINFAQEKNHTSQKGKTSNSEAMPAFQDDKFNIFVAEFDVSKLDNVNASGNSNDQYNPRTKELQSEVDSLKEQLKKANLEKAEMTSKYEKLSAICRSQRQEIQGLKHALTAANSSPAKDQQKEKKSDGTTWELQQGLSAKTSLPASEPNSWLAFDSEPEFQATQGRKHGASLDTPNGHSQTASAARPSADVWGSNLDNFTKSSANANTPISTSVTRGNTSKTFINGAAKKVDSGQPAGWAGF